MTNINPNANEELDEPDFRELDPIEVADALDTFAHRYATSGDYEHATLMINAAEWLYYLAEKVAELEDK